MPLSIDKGGTGVTTIEALREEVTGFDRTLNISSTREGGIDNTIIGKSAGTLATTCDASIIIGKNAANIATSVDDSTIVGTRSCFNADNVIGSAILGFSAASMNFTKPTDDAGAETDRILKSVVAVGSVSLNNCNSVTFSSLVGSHILNSALTVSNTTVIGSSALSGCTTISDTVAAGNGTAASCTSVSTSVLLGYHACYSSNTAATSVVIGSDAASKKSVLSNDVIIGYSALRKYAGSNSSITAIGRCAGYKITSATSCVIIGGDAMFNQTTGTRCVVIGNSAGSGDGTANSSIVNSVLAGYWAGHNITKSSQDVFVGSNCGQNVKTASNSTCIGFNTAENVTDLSYSILIGSGVGKMVAPTEDTPTRAIENSVIIGASSIGGGTSGKNVLSDATLIGIGCSHNYGGITHSQIIGGETGGTILALGSSMDQSFVGGTNALHPGLGSVACVIIGTSAGAITDTTNYSPYKTMHELNTLVGYKAGMDVHCSAITNKATKNTFIGAFSGNELLEPVNCTCLGYRATVTGSNQVQLGDSNTTTYVYGTVQNRSDARDKTNITDLDYDYKTFISKLKPRNFQWDYREDYIPELVRDDEGNIINEDETQIQMDQIVPDGTHARSRRHNGFIAQEVKAVMDEMGFDFAGYQDHSVNGGNDVLSLGYEEFIAPMVACTQDLMKENQQLRDEVAAIKQHLQL